MDTLVSLLAGHLSATERVVSAVAPGVALLVVLLLGAVAYAVRTLVFGRFHDEEMDGRGLGGLTTARLRHFFAWLMRPLWRGLALAQVPPNAITTLSVAFAIGSGVAAAAGRFSLAGWVFLAAGGLDFLDGRVARATGRASRGGAALDSVLDRYCESALLVGLAWYYRESWALMAVLLALTGSLFVPYVRARGEALGAKLSDVGFMQRPERILVLGVTVALAPIVEALVAPNDPRPPHRLAVAGLLLLAFTSHGTALQRLVYLVRALSTRPKRLRSLSRSVVVSVIATAVDFVVVFTLERTVGLSLPAATMAGCVVGGCLTFALSHAWAFQVRTGDLRRQLVRFVFVSGTSALLNSGGVAVLLLLPGLLPGLVWLITRALVFACWNFPLMSEWAFADEHADDRRPAPPTELDPADLGGKSATGTS